MANLRKTNRVLYFIIIVLLAVVVFLFVRNRKAESERAESFTQGVQLQSELSKVMEEYNVVKMENQELSAQMSEKDSIISANRKEIEQLIAMKADYKKIRKKLDLLRKITQDYVARIDSLVVENQNLTAENTQLTEKVTKFQRQNTKLEAENQQILSVASALKVYGLQIQTVSVSGKGKEKPTDNAKKVKRINMTFTLSENKIVKAGTKAVYARISRPDGEVMVPGTDDLYSFEFKGEKLQYTMKEEVDYRNEAVEVKMVWDRKDAAPAMVGTYEVMIYMEGAEIGRGAFTIR